MKIGIITDTHLGYAWGTPRQEDSFIQAEEGIKKLLDAGVDVIIHAGDIFDSPIPRPEVMAKAIDIFSECNSHKSSVQITSYFGEEAPKNKSKGIPIIAIHGNHERRPKGMTNALQLLEKAGILIYLHGSGLSLNNEVGIFGMGYVPERYALSAFQKWDLKSDLNKNILLLHQAISEIFSAPGDPSTITMSDLPKNFMTICGHIHWSVEKPGLILPGSTIRTQMGENEPNEKKVFILDTNNRNLDKIILKTPRPFFHEKVDVSGKTPDQILNECELLAMKLEQDQRAIMRIKLIGKLEEGFEPRDLRLDALRRKFQLLFIDKSIESKHLLPTLPEGAGLDEMLAKALEKSIEKRGLKLDARLLINHLLAGNMDALMEVLSVDTKN
jgi:DNA repair exonuclease SbcCD nuclease subunit